MAGLGHVIAFVDGIAKHMQAGAQGLDGSFLLQSLLPGIVALIAAPFAMLWCHIDQDLLAYRVSSLSCKTAPTYCDPGGFTSA